MESDAWIGVVGMILKNPSSEKINLNNPEFKTNSRESRKNFELRGRFFIWLLKREQISIKNSLQLYGILNKELNRLFIKISNFLNNLNTI